MVSLLFSMPVAVRLLVALQGAHFAFADVSNNTASSKPASSPSVTALPSGPPGDCSANCKVFAHTTQWYWVPLQITTTLTAATVLYVVGKDGTTRTSTVYADLPGGYTRPPTNDKGTHVESLSWTDAGGKVGTTTIAFPTQFNAYPAGYTWDGTLSTVDKAGKSVCATASSSYVPFSPYATPTQDSIVDSLLGKDGTLYHLAMESIGGPAHKSINPNDAAPQVCSTPGFVAPAAAVQSAQFLTVTSTSHEALTPTSTSQETLPPPSVTTPENQVTSTSQTSAVTSTCASADCDDDNDLPKPIITCDKNDPGSCPTTTTPPPPPPVTSTCTSADCDDGNNPPKPIVTCDKDDPDSCPKTTQIPTTVVPPIMLNGTMYSATPLGTVAPKGSRPGTTTMGYVLPGATLAPGSTITVGSGLMAQTIVLRTKSSLTQLEVDGETSVLPTGMPVPVKSRETGMTEGQTASAGGRTAIGGGVITGSAVVTSGPDVVVIGGSTVTSGTVVSIVGGKTVPAIPAVVINGGTTLTQNGAVIVTGGKTMTDSLNPVFVIDGKTLSVGGSITVGSSASTTIIALSTDKSGNSVLVVGSKTSTMIHAAATGGGGASTGTIGVGGYINSGLGGMGLIISSTSATGVAKTTASAAAAGVSNSGSAGLVSSFVGEIEGLGMGFMVFMVVVPFLLLL